MQKEKISLQSARRLFLSSQLLAGKMKLDQGKEGILQTINKLGYVQIDPLSVIQRAHHHTLWTRLPDYDHDNLNQLQAKDRLIFEYWGHALSYLLIADYRYFLIRMKNFENPQTKWVKTLYEQSKAVIKPVLERIQNEGSLSIKEFEAKSKGTNVHDYKKSVRVALEFLFWRGDLMVTERNNLQKYYDLTERVLPDKINTSIPESREICRFLVNRALSAFGLAQEKEIRLFMQPESSRDFHFLAADQKLISFYLKELEESGEITSLQIEGIDATYFTLKDNIEYISTLQTSSSEVYILSPFDNLIIQRERTKQLFGFDYSLECYTPAAKRKYGYFVLPVLWGDNLIARFDAKADRKNTALKIINLVFEPEFTAFDEFLPIFAKKLLEFSCFNSCNQIDFEEVTPVKAKPKLNRMVNL